MKDFLGVELEVGDSAIFMEAGYKSLRRGKIIKFTPKMVSIEDYDEPRSKYFPRKFVNKFPKDIIVYEYKS